MIFQRVTLTGEEDAYLDCYIADPIPHLTRKAMLVIPGGGYGTVCSEREGEPIAQAFIPYGYNAFVLHYYVGKEKPFPIQLIQVAKAIKHIKDHAEEYGIDPEELFVVGFSAGGHLAASAGVLWKHPALYEAVDMPYGYNKPRGMMLVYPVVSAIEEYSHKGSAHKLLATKEPTEEQLFAVSIEKHVDADSTPAFMVHTSNDQVVDVRNSLALGAAYREVGLQFELHVFPDAPHGWGLGNRITATGRERYVNPAMAEWVRMAAYWAEHLPKNEENI